ncbi:o-succinylbenzoate synthase [Myxococcota bacterium]|nr:o-succinylbenzoate synthase [Myxococcota bacterium]
MKITGARIDPVALPLRDPLVTARGAVHTRRGFVLRLRSETGATGVGEALPLEAFGSEALEVSQSFAQRKVQALMGTPLDQALEEMNSSAEDHAPAAHCAVEVALLDLLGQDRGERLADGLGQAEPLAGVAVNALINAEAPDAVARAVERTRENGIGCVKLKLGARSADLDESRVAAARRAGGPELTLRLDANGSWKEPDALSALERLAAYDIEYVEQPTATHDIEALRRVRAASPIAVAADESLDGVAGTLQVLDREAADVLILKPPTLGGPRATLRIARLAAQRGVECVVTSFIDSSLGIAAALHTAAALRPSRACGLATQAILADDLGPPLTPLSGRLNLPTGPGLGLAADDAGLARCRVAPPTEFST